MKQSAHNSLYGKSSILPRHLHPKKKQRKINTTDKNKLCILKRIAIQNLMTHFATMEQILAVRSPLKS